METLTLINDQCASYGDRLIMFQMSNVELEHDENRKEMELLGTG